MDSCPRNVLWVAVNCDHPFGLCRPVSTFGYPVDTQGTVTIDSEGRVVDMTCGLHHADQDWLDSLSTERFSCYAGQTIEYGCDGDY